jgi:hypothetical protein
VRDQLLHDGMISPEDVDLLALTDDPAEAARIVVECHERKCGSPPAVAEKADAQ